MKKIIKIFLIIFFLTTPSLVMAQELIVPWTVQAPEGNWNQPWQDACEETAILMLDFYYADKPGFTKELAKQEILKIFDNKQTLIGYSYDENVDVMLKLINSFSNWTGYKVNNPTISQLKIQIDLGYPVIVPVYAPLLKNPYYSSPGPDYHVIVLRGYDESTQRFVVNDPGTSHGQGLRFDYSVIMNAIHDYIPSDMKNGPQSVIFSRPANKYFKTAVLAKTKDNPMVYLILGDKRHHILNEKVFKQNGWHWSQIKLVSQGVLSEFIEDNQIIGEFNGVE